MTIQYETKSEELFAQYLISQNLTAFEHEPNRDKIGKKNPDFVVQYKDQPVIFDVKEFEIKLLPAGQPIWYDGYGRIREKINTASKQFKQFKQFPCSLVLYSEDPLVNLLDESVMVGSMYGDACVSWKWNTETSSSDLSTTVNTFHGDGKMVYIDKDVPNVPTGAGRVQNTTFSALITLRWVRPGFLRLRKYFRETGDLTFSAIDFDKDESHLGVIVWDNYYARKPLHPDMFCGPYDEHYGFNKEGVLTRLFAGEGILAYESLQQELM